jgi:transposase
VDVPPKLSARARVFSTGQGRKTDTTDAHSVALVGVRMAGLRPVVDDQQLTVLRVLVDRRRSLGTDHTRMIAQLHHLLLELVPGGAKKNLSAAQLRNATEGRAYYDRKKAAAKTSMESMRALKRRLSNLVYNTMLDDAARTSGTGLGRQRDSDSDSSATGSQPQHRHFGQATPGPVTT